MFCHNTECGKTVNGNTQTCPACKATKASGPNGGTWLAESPLTRIAGGGANSSASDIQNGQPDPDKLKAEFHRLMAAAQDQAAAKAWRALLDTIVAGFAEWLKVTLEYDMADIAGGGAENQSKLIGRYITACAPDLFPDIKDTLTMRLLTIIQAAGLTVTSGSTASSTSMDAYFRDKLPKMDQPISTKERRELADSAMGFIAMANDTRTSNCGVLMSELLKVQDKYDQDDRDADIDRVIKLLLRWAANPKDDLRLTAVRDLTTRLVGGAATTHFTATHTRQQMHDGGSGSRGRGKRRGGGGGGGGGRDHDQRDDFRGDRRRGGGRGRGRGRAGHGAQAADE